MLGSMEKIIAVIGPTGIGKSDFALDLARKNNAEIISADAFQVYRYMDIGTAKVSLSVRQEIPHYLIDIKDPDEAYSVAEFLSLVRQKIVDIQARKKSVIICGGTAFYLRAFLYNYQFVQEGVDAGLRAGILAEIQEIGNAAAWEKLHKLDPAAAKIIEPQNTKRLIRAFEIYEQTKQLPSEMRKKAEQPRTDTQIIELTAPRELIYDRINQRVDRMICDGLIEEVENLLKMGYNPQLLAFQALGYKETIQYLNGTMTKLDMIEYIKQKTRNFAKRQLTWYKRFENVFSIDITKNF
jgi:tRNA dimethylallyltransferase